MPSPTSSASSGRVLARQARAQFMRVMQEGLPGLIAVVQQQLQVLVDQTGTAREMQANRDAWMDWNQHKQAWQLRVKEAWEQSDAPVSVTEMARLDVMSLELVGDDVVENRIQASRLAQAMGEKVASAFTSLSSRLKELEGRELSARDPLRLDVLPLLLMEQWTEAGLSRDALQRVIGALRAELARLYLSAYEQADRFLVQQGVQVNEDWRDRVRRAPEGAPSGRAPLTSVGSGPGEGASGAQPMHSSRGAPFASGSAGASGRPAYGGDETRLQTAMNPLLKARARANGLLGQLHRLLSRQSIVLPARSGGGGGGGSGRVALGSETDADLSETVGPIPLASAALAQALAVTPRRERDLGMPSGGGTLILDVSPQGVARAVTSVREKATELKQKTDDKAEKATIEIVALMFQSILAEERIPPSIRVWFARLQVPVLRVALAEPEFFDTLTHPARLLIDRMGSCVLGFDPGAINGSALETEIRRVVQVIEQYPETGRRVFQLVYEEFQKFLARFLTEKSQTSKLVSVAQQVEQKEALAIQYTIELRNQLKDMPVRDEIREFLFKVWAEVLAVSAVRLGPQHEETISLKKAASDLVWAASAKPNRADRARVIHDLPMLLQRLRQGLSKLGVTGAPQEAHIKVLSETLADAFLSKTEAIPQATIDAMAKRLSRLEDYVTDEGLDELPLDAESLEVMLGVDSAAIHIVANGGVQPSQDMLAWALELQTGHWFTLDHNGAVKQVQYAWCSDRRQLHLFAAMDGSSYLIQLKRLAAYLQAGLLAPQEDETLTLRATRQALAKLDANPERLLQ